MQRFTVSNVSQKFTLVKASWMMPNVHIKWLAKWAYVSYLWTCSTWDPFAVAWMECWWELIALPPRVGFLVVTPYSEMRSKYWHETMILRAIACLLASLHLGLPVSVNQPVAGFDSPISVSVLVSTSSGPLGWRCF